MTCSFDPKPYIGVPIGMFHCPECGEMVVAGMDHPNYALLESEEVMKDLDLSTKTSQEVIQAYKKPWYRIPRGCFNLFYACPILTALFLILWIFGIIQWELIWVFSPLWIGWLFGAGAATWLYYIRRI